MALKFICDNCREEYEATPTMSSGKIKVEGELLDVDDPCPDCQKEAEAAKEVALAKRKKTE